MNTVVHRSLPTLPIGLLAGAVAFDLLRRRRPVGSPPDVPTVVGHVGGRVRGAVRLAAGRRQDVVAARATWSCASLAGTARGARRGRARLVPRSPDPGHRRRRAGRAAQPGPLRGAGPGDVGRPVPRRAPAAHAVGRQPAHRPAHGDRPPGGARRGRRDVGRLGVGLHPDQRARREPLGLGARLARRAVHGRGAGPRAGPVPGLLVRRRGPAVRRGRLRRRRPRRCRWCRTTSRPRSRRRRPRCSPACCPSSCCSPASPRRCATRCTPAPTDD